MDNSRGVSDDDHHRPIESPYIEAEPTHQKPVIIGLYGLPGSGKSYWMEKLAQELSDERFTCYEGSHVIAAVTPGGIQAFQELPDEEKVKHRNQAIAHIEKECFIKGNHAIVTGHFMFWPEKDEQGHAVCTQGDMKTYTHIIYLNVSPTALANYRSADTERNRPQASVSHLIKWMEAEKSQLSLLCRSNGILFAAVSPPISTKMLCSLIRDFRDHTEETNLKIAKSRMDEIVAVAAGSGNLETVLVLDADKTLAGEDSGSLFWQQVGWYSTEHEDIDPFRVLFSSPLQYSYTAFRQATLLYEEAVDIEDFDHCCSNVAEKISMHREMVWLLHSLLKHSHVRAVVVTCGLRAVWEKVLKKEGLSNSVQVIGSGRPRDDLVITPAVKAALVMHLRTVHQLYVIAIGDGPVDLEMLRAADQAIVVTGSEESRSKSMEHKLADVIGKDGFYPQQVLLPPGTTPRLDSTRLPLVELMSSHFLDMVLGSSQTLEVAHATKKSAAKLLMSPMRDASLSGSALRNAHHRTGWYLATEFCTQIIGTESYPITHVQGHTIGGHRLLHEKKTLIVPLMRGGEPMAFGVSEALPLAIFRHADVPGDIEKHHLENMAHIVLVDSVVNSGKSILQFVRHIRSLNNTIQIVVIAGVIHSQTVSIGRIAGILGRIRNLSFIALRLSDNKFTGRGTTDTGNRLFNTTHMT